MSSLVAAIALATHAHDGQRDLLGVEYVRHPLAVMRKVDTIEEKIVAVLHDVIERTAVTFVVLRERGFDERTIAAIDALTRRPGESGEVFVQRILADPLAMSVKRASLAHHLDPERVDALTPSDRLRVLEHGRSLAMLLGTTVDEVIDAYR